MGKYGIEKLNVEFKSDQKNLPDREVVEAVVALSNSDGGTLYLGVEDDGTPTGVQSQHQDPVGLTAMIANNTVPPVSVRVDAISEDKKTVLAITVSQSQSIVSTRGGKILRRSLKSDGTPESVPMYPHEFVTRLSDLKRLDYSAQPMLESSVKDFDPIELERLRKIISTYQSSDRNLLELTDEELEKSLHLTTQINDVTVPTLTGLLLVGKENVLQKIVPTHDAVFQVRVGTEIKVNQTCSGSLLKVIEQIFDLLQPWNSGTEISIGLFSQVIPEFDDRAFREALINAFGHRDYAKLGRVRVSVDDAGLTIANPGGFVEGININNLLTAEPYGRNPCLMDALKRIGLAERTGRGIDRIFEGALNFGRLLPDYSQSNETGVTVLLPRSTPDLSFIQLLISEREKTGKPLSLESLLVLNKLKDERRCEFEELHNSLDMSEQRLRAVLGQLVEAGIIESLGVGKKRSFMLGARVYKRSGKVVEYVRQSDIDKVRYPEMILKLVSQQNEVSKKDVMALLHIDGNQAYYQLKKLVNGGQLVSVGNGRSVRYRCA